MHDNHLKFSETWGASLTNIAFNLAIVLILPKNLPLFYIQEFYTSMSRNICMKFFV